MLISAGNEFSWRGYLHSEIGTAIARCKNNVLCYASVSSALQIPKTNKSRLELIYTYYVEYSQKKIVR